MRKVTLDMNEKNKFEIIKKLVGNEGNKKRAAFELGITIRQVNRLIAGYKTQGKAFFVHGNKGRKPIHALCEKTKNLIKDLYSLKYYDMNFTQFSEFLEKEEKIKVSLKTIRTFLRQDHILSPKAKIATKKMLKKELELLKESAPSKKIVKEIVSKIVDVGNVHPRRSRCKYFGEMIQMDASQFKWFGGVVTHLHVAIDDFSGKIVGAYFANQETLEAYYNVLRQILIDYGIPAMFYTDRRTVFEYKRKETSSLQKDTSTQFEYACKQLGIEIKTSSVPENKGRVERLNQTLQSRLPPELRLANVYTIERANEFLKDFIKKFNERFTLSTNKYTPSVFENHPGLEKINQILAVITKRKVDNGNSIKYNNNFYKFIKSNGNAVFYRKGTECLVIKAFNGELFASVEDQICALEKIPEHQATSKKFDIKPDIASKSKCIYIPPMSHPWRKKSFDRFIARQAHRNSSVA